MFAIAKKVNKRHRLIIIPKMTLISSTFFQIGTGTPFSKDPYSSTQYSHILKVNGEGSRLCQAKKRSKRIMLRNHNPTQEQP